MLLPIIILLITIDLATSATIKIFACEISDGTKCALFGITQNESQPNFIAIAPDPHAITEVTIRNSIIPVWTEDVCNAFPNLTVINCENAGMERIRVNSFENCTQLVELDFDFNEITTIEANTFRGLKHLKNLFLWNNRLTSFSADIVAGMEELADLQICSNMIYDIDAERMLANCPKLKEIRLNDNNLRCKRIVEILTMFKVYGVNARDSVGQYRSREEVANEVMGFTCLSDGQWNGSLYRSVDDPKLMEHLSLKLTYAGTMAKDLNASISEQVVAARDEVLIKVQTMVDRLNINIARKLSTDREKFLTGIAETFEREDQRLRHLHEKATATKSEVKIVQQGESWSWIMIGSVVLMVNLVILIGVGLMVFRLMKVKQRFFLQLEKRNTGSDNFYIA